MKKDISLLRYRGAIPMILAYQVAAKLLLAGAMQLFGMLTGELLWHIQRPAFTSGDLPFLLRTWQGWLLLLVGFAVLMMYTALDVNAMILLGRQYLYREKISIRKVLTEAFGSMKRLLNPAGFAVVLYLGLIAPLTMLTFHISLTKNFVIPDFIMSVIRNTPWMHLLYNAAMVVLTVAGFLGIFTFHFVVLGKQSAKQAVKSSVQVMRGHWLNFAVRYLWCLLKMLLVSAAVTFVTCSLPITAVNLLIGNVTAKRVLTIFFGIMMFLISAGSGMLISFFSLMKMTLLYADYSEDTQSVPTPPEKSSHKKAVIVCALTAAVVLVLSMPMGIYFDEFFPPRPVSRIIAHRAGGSLGNENTVYGLEQAIAHGAYAGEMDVQRTKDGHYIINHDDTFDRVCGDPRASYEMTLEEIRQLRVKDLVHPDAPAVPVSTMEEMLDTAKGKIGLLIELKGATADMQMADDVYQMIVQRDMLDQCMFISLDFELINAVETKYPEIATGYLCYFAFGSVADMNCDFLLLEEETATDDNIDRIHEAGKEIYIWTVDSNTSITRAFNGEADGIITDSVAEAEEIRDAFDRRPDYVRVLQSIVR